MRIQINSSGGCCSLVNHYDPPLEADLDESDDVEFKYMLTIDDEIFYGDSTIECVNSLHESILCPYVLFETNLGKKLAKNFKHATVEAPEGFIFSEPIEVRLFVDD